MIVAIEHAMNQQKQQNQRQIMHHLQQDKSPGKVPALNFNMLENQLENEVEEQAEEEYQEESQTMGEEDESTRQFIDALENPNQEEIHIMPNNVIQKPMGFGLGLNLGAIGAKEDYQDEFMARVDEFSESWRQQLRKEKRF